MAFLIFKTETEHLSTYLHFGQREIDVLSILNSKYNTEQAARDLINQGDLICVREEDIVTFEKEYSLPPEECKPINLNKHELSARGERYIFENGAWTLTN
jgi:hypothetical protein